MREQCTIQSELELAKRREVIALQEKKVAEQEKQAAESREALALAEIEHLKALLAQKA